MRSAIPGSFLGLMMLACTAAPTTTSAPLTVRLPPPASTAPDPEPGAAVTKAIEEIVPGVGLVGLPPLGKLTRALVVEELGPPSETLDHAHYTVELVYASGLRAFYCYADPTQQIILLRADAPMRVRARGGITRGVSTVSDVFRLHGDKQPFVPPEGRGFIETPGLLFEFDLLPGEAARPFETGAMRSRTIQSMSALIPETGLFVCSREDGE
jgi:hypothetical protein